MTTEALYYQTKLKVNRLGTGVGVNMEPAVWVSLYNTAQDIWWKQALQLRSDSVLRDQLSSLLVTDETLVPRTQDERCYRFTLPQQLYQITDVYVSAKAGTCLRTFSAAAVSPHWINENWNNVLSCPSFDWEETAYAVANKELLVYYKDFKVDSTLISYYQKPEDVDLPGYIKTDGSPSRLIDTDLPAELQQEVLQTLYQLLQ